METEPVELEDGEVVDDEVVDAFEAYNVLQRPHVAPRPEDTSKMRYSDESDEPTESESDSDSDSAHVCSKKPKMKIKRWRNNAVEKSDGKDKYKVWCMQVQEEALTEELVSCGVTKRDYQDRNVEFYDFTLRYSPSEQQTPADHSSHDEKDVAEPRLTNKRSNEDRTNLKLRLGKRRNSMEIDGQRGVARKISELCTNKDSTDADLAADIAEKLCEKKDDLIKRVVSILGKEKAIEFFEQTKKIEEEGGMMIMNGSRRRTPGGVFLLLLKKDDHIPQEKIRAIFQEDRKQNVEQKKQAHASNRRQKTQELMRSLENGSEKDLPALLTRAELSTRQIAEEARLRRGEGRERERTPPDSDRPVTNPPPSPVTDDPDHTPPSSRRQVQDYSTDDFLDIGVDVDSMELF